MAGRWTAGSPERPKTVILTQNAGGSVIYTDRRLGLVKCLQTKFKRDYLS